MYIVAPRDTLNKIDEKYDHQSSVTLIYLELNMTFNGPDISIEIAKSHVTDTVHIDQKQHEDGKWTITGMITKRSRNVVGSLATCLWHSYLSVMLEI